MLPNPDDVVLKVILVGDSGNKNKKNISTSKQ
jgi:hypothetical protein